LCYDLNSCLKRVFCVTNPSLTKNEDVRRRLVEAAGQVFAEVGYEAATVRQITERAEANVAAINYHFGDKLQLFRSVLQLVTSHVMSQIEANCAAGTAEQRLLQFIRTTLSVESEGEYPWAPLLMAREITEFNATPAAFIVEAVRPLHVTAEQIVADLTGCRDMQHVQIAASMLVTLCVTRFRQHRLDRMLAKNPSQIPDDVAGTVESVFRFALAGISGLCGRE